MMGATGLRMSPVFCPDFSLAPQIMGCEELIKKLMLLLGEKKIRASISLSKENGSYVCTVTELGESWIRHRFRSKSKIGAIVTAIAGMG